MGGSQGPEQISYLTGRFVGQPVLALVDAGTNPAAILSAMRAGATQVVVLPLQAEDFGAALDCIALQFGSAPGNATVVAVSGTTGGCGGTAIAINLAYEIACSHKLSCILIDLSVNMGTVTSYLNVEPRYTTRELLREIDRLDVHMVRQALVRFADDFDILAGPKAITSLEARPEDVKLIVDYAKQLATVIVLDVPCTYNNLYFNALATASEIVLIGEQSVPSMRALALIRDVLDRDTSSLSQCLVINRYDPKLPGFSRRDLEKVLKVSRLHTIAKDPAVTASINNGRPIRLEAPGSQALADITALAEEVIGVAVPQRPHPPSRAVFGRVLRAMGVAS